MLLKMVYIVQYEYLGKEGQKVASTAVPLVLNIIASKQIKYAKYD